MGGLTAGGFSYLAYFLDKDTLAPTYLPPIPFPSPNPTCGLVTRSDGGKEVAVTTQLGATFTFLFDLQGLYWSMASVGDTLQSGAAAVAFQGAKTFYAVGGGPSQDAKK